MRWICKIPPVARDGTQQYLTSNPTLPIVSPALVHIVRKIPHAVFIPYTFTITQEPESILRVISDVEVLTTHVLKTILEV